MMPEKRKLLGKGRVCY